MRSFSLRKQAKEQHVRKNLAIEDMRFLGAASLIAADHTQVTGKRKEAFEELYIVGKRFQLEPETIMAMLHELHPELANITPPPPSSSQDNFVCAIN